MKMQLPYLYFTFILCTISFKAPVMRCQNVTCNSTDLRALINFSSCIESGIDGWDISSSDCCSWNGVTCDNSTTSSKRVVKLELARKGLRGSICKSFEGLDELRILNLSANILLGYLNPYHFSLQKLEVIDMSNNDFYGQLLHGDDLPSLWYVDLSMNRFGGSIDATYCSMSPLIEVLNLANNYLIGEVSESFVKCSSLQHLFLNGNQISGSFPKSLLQLRDLRTLKLQENLFSGSLNGGIGNLSKLVELDLSFNRFNGFLPDVFDQLETLEHFSARSNQFSGQMPKSLVLDLSQNHLGGSIPYWIGTFKYLLYLNLSSNSLTGEIPEGLTELPSLIDMNISLERFATKIRSSIPSLDLSYNMLTGHIPPSIGNLRKLYILNLKYNSLSGPIPGSLSRMTNLGTLDLSHNKLSGEIPYTLEELSFLSNFNVSYNQLHGEVPERGQLRTFPCTSFIGNPGLPCGWFDYSPPAHTLYHTIPPPPVVLPSDKMTIMGWPFVFGVPTGFLITVGFCFATGWIFPKPEKRKVRVTRIGR
ncbi:phytosulfokine receptor 1-like [Populus alba x Populus x berolinensis]|nr:phytosulfokine receptor 1-like [Populus alba x Populus x berolinensis]